MQALAFYFFAALTLCPAIAVVLARNPIHSIFNLILAFFGAAGLFVLLGAEFLGMLLIVVYVGAVAVLFLFVVMMLDLPKNSLKSWIFKDIKEASLACLRFFSYSILFLGNFALCLFSTLLLLDHLGWEVNVEEFIQVFQNLDVFNILIVLFISLLFAWISRWIAQRLLSRNFTDLCEDIL